MKHASKVLVFGGLKNHRTLVRFSSTSYIKHLAVSGLSKVSARIKSTCNLTGMCFEMPNVSYTKPLAFIGRPTATQNKQNRKLLIKTNHKQLKKEDTCDTND
jgi:hypothetical protein